RTHALLRLANQLSRREPALARRCLTVAFRNLLAWADDAARTRCPEEAVAIAEAAEALAALDRRLGGARGSAPTATPKTRAPSPPKPRATSESRTTPRGHP